MRKIIVSVLTLIGGGIAGFAYGQPPEPPPGPPGSPAEPFCHVTPNGEEVQLYFSSSATGSASTNGRAAHLDNHPDDYDGVCFTLDNDLPA